MLVFEIGTVVVCVVSAVIAAVSFVRGLKLYDKIGQLGTFAMTHDEEPSAATCTWSARRSARCWTPSRKRARRGVSDRPPPSCSTCSRRAPQSGQRPVQARLRTTRRGHTNRCPARPQSRCWRIRQPACARLLTAAAAAGGQLVLAGGRTPRPAYEHTARDLAVWHAATLWFGDERCVSPKDERSNYRMVQSALLNRLDAACWPDVQRIRAELGPREAADDYERRLRDAGPGRFDLVLLGLGPDGHTASLFPDQDALGERERLVVGVEHPARAPFVPRVTLTLPALASTGRVVYRGAAGGAGELGHTIVGLEAWDWAVPAPTAFPQPGSLESFAAGHALDRLAAQAAERHPASALGRLRAGGRPVVGEDAVRAARDGDQAAAAAVEIWAEHVGIGVASAIDTFDPDEVVIGGGAALAGELLLQPATRVARGYVLPGLGTRTVIRLARHGVRAGVLGAALLAIHEVGEV